MTGTLTWWDPARCYGRILGEDSVDYYVHTSDVTGPRLVQGCRVAFEQGWARRRPRAVAVRRLEETEASSGIDGAGLSSGNQAAARSRPRSASGPARRLDRPDVGTRRA
jgi:cold shock CspA family protein